MNLTLEQKQKLEAFARMVMEANLLLNLTAHADFETMWERHILDSLAAVDYLRHMESQGVPQRLIDIGSGAGFPGIPLAIALPFWQITSLEATQKKAHFQHGTIERLGLPNVQVLSERAEELARMPNHREQYGAATARALAPLPVVAELALPFVRVGGVALAWKGPKASDEMRDTLPACARLGARFDNAISYKLAVPGEELPDFYLVPMLKCTPTPAFYPRQPAIIRKKPLIF